MDTTCSLLPNVFIQCTCVSITLYKGHHCALSCLQTVTRSNSVHRLSGLSLFLSFLYLLSCLCISFISHFILCSSSLLFSTDLAHLFLYFLLLSSLLLISCSSSLTSACQINAWTALENYALGTPGRQSITLLGRFRNRLISILALNVLQTASTCMEPLIIRDNLAPPDRRSNRQ